MRPNRRTTRRSGKHRRITVARKRNARGASGRSISLKRLHKDLASAGVMTAKELAHYLNLSPRKVYHLLNMKGTRRLPGYRLEGRWLINLAHIQDWLLDRVEAGDGRAKRPREPHGDSN